MTTRLCKEEDRIAKSRKPSIPPSLPHSLSLSVRACVRRLWCFFFPLKIDLGFVVGVGVVRG